MFNENNEEIKVVLLCSGGLDSIVAGYDQIAQNRIVYPLFISYGQTHIIEVDNARAFSISKAKHKLKEAEFNLGALVGGSTTLAGDRGAKTITEDIPNPDKDRMRNVVPFRNFLFLLAASAYAYDVGAQLICIAANRDDRIRYQDCRPRTLERSMTVINDFLKDQFDARPLTLLMPFTNFTKGQIVQIGMRLEVPFEKTHTCYRGERPFCGRCDSCIDRLKAFREAGIEDPVPYAYIPPEFKHVAEDN